MPVRAAPPNDDPAIQRAARLIAEADALVIAAGADMGVDSGLPDFRGRDGFWREYPALREAGIDLSEIASSAAFESVPELAWGFYGHRLALYRRTEPHAGFALLKRWGEGMRHGYGVFTSNVDGQFRKAGFDAERIHECHGSIHHLQCLVPCDESIWEARGFEPDVDEQCCRLRNPMPTCPRCGGLARPNILMFGDWGWQAWQTEQRGERERLASLSRAVIIKLGAGTAIPSVRHFGQRVVQHHGGRLVRINPLDCVVPAGAGVGLGDGGRGGARGHRRRPRHAIRG